MLFNKVLRRDVHKDCAGPSPGPSPRRCTPVGPGRSLSKKLHLLHRQELRWSWAGEFPQPLPPPVPRGLSFHAEKPSALHSTFWEMDLSFQLPNNLKKKKKILINFCVWTFSKLMFWPLPLTWFIKGYERETVYINKNPTHRGLHTPRHRKQTENSLEM